MPRTRTLYLTVFREQILELHRAGQSAQDLAQDFQPCVATIPTRIRRAALDGGKRADILGRGARDELRRLRRENKQLRQENHPFKSCGAVRTERRDAIEVFEFMAAKRAEFPGRDLGVIDWPVPERFSGL